MSDQIIATGDVTITGGDVNVIAAPGVYGLSTDYVILQSTGGSVTGIFDDATVDLAF